MAGLLFASYSVNLVGPDFYIGAAPLLLAIGAYSGAVKLRLLAMPGTLGFMSGLFLISYYISNVFGAPEWSWVGNFTVNVVAAVFIIGYVRSAPSARILLGGLLFGFLGTNAISILVLYFEWTVPSWLFSPALGGRYQALIGDPNMLGTLAVILSIWLIDRCLSPGRPRKKFASYIALIATIAVLVASESRSAWLAFFISTAAFFAFPRRMPLTSRAPWALLLLGVCSSVLALFVDFHGARTKLRDRLWMSGFEDKEEKRLEFFYTRRAFSFGLTRPFGVGTGRTGLAFADSEGLSLGAHNTYVNVWSDNGWLAAACFPAAGCLLLFGIWGISRDVREIAGIGVRVPFAMLLALAVNGLWQDMILWNIFWVPPALAIALIIDRRGQIAARSSPGFIQSRFACGPHL